MRRKRRKLRWKLHSGMIMVPHRETFVEKALGCLQKKSDNVVCYNENTVCCGGTFSRQTLTSRPSLLSSLLYLLVCVAVVSATGQGQQFTFNPDGKTTKASATSPTGSTPHNFRDKADPGEGIRYTLMEVQPPVHTPTPPLPSTSPVLPSSSIPVSVQSESPDSVYGSSLYTEHGPDVTEAVTQDSATQQSHTSPLPDYTDYSLEPSVIVTHPSTPSSDMPTPPLHIVPSSSHQMISDVQPETLVKPTSVSQLQLLSASGDEARTINRSSSSRSSREPSSFVSPQLSSMYEDSISSVLILPSDSISKVSLLPSSHASSSLAVSSSLVDETSTMSEDEATVSWMTVSNVWLSSSQTTSEATDMTARYGSHPATAGDDQVTTSSLITPHTTDDPDHSVMNSTDIATTHDSIDNTMVDFAVKITASSVIRCADTPESKNVTAFVLQYIVEHLELNESHVFINRPNTGCDCMTVNMLSFNRSKVKEVENLVRSRQLSFIMNFTSNKEMHVLRFVASSAVRFDASNLGGGVDECSAASSRRALWRRLSGIERAIVIAVCTAGGLVVLLALAFCLYEVQRRHYRKSFRLHTAPSLTLQTEDFTLTKLERPKTMYYEGGLIMEPIHADEVHIPSSMPSSTSLEKQPGHHLMNGNHKAQWPLAPDPFPIQPSTSTENLVAAAAAARRRAGRDREKSPGFDNPSFSSEDILASDGEDGQDPDDLEGLPTNVNQKKSPFCEFNGISSSDKSVTLAANDSSKVILNGHSFHSNGNVASKTESNS